METGHPSTRAVNSGSGNRAQRSLQLHWRHLCVTYRTQAFMIIITHTFMDSTSCLRSSAANMSFTDFVTASQQHEFKAIETLAAHLRHCLVPRSVYTLSLGTCESEIFVRIESRIESKFTIPIRIESRIESGCSRLRVECRLPPSSSSHQLLWRSSARAQQRLT